MPEASGGEPQPRLLNGAQAILEATEEALRRHPEVFVLGEGAQDPKGIFGTTTGLAETFGSHRVMEMPLAENAFTGMAIGAALMGQRALVIHQRVEFSLLAMEQLLNNAAKMFYVTGGRHRVPLTMRVVVGRGWGQGPAHSQSLENLFAGVPGLKVVLPSGAADLKGLLLGSIEDDNPVAFIEHRWVHYSTGQVAAGYAPLPLDGPRRLRPGRDVTVVASSYMTLEALQAADALAEHGIEVELFDLRVARPLVLDEVFESVARTGRLLTIDVGFLRFGLGAEIVAQTTAEVFDDLLAAPRRLGLPDHPTPSSRSLAEAFYIRSPRIGAEVCDLVGAAAEVRSLVEEGLRSGRDDLPLDIPHPSFKGPF